MKWNAQTTVVIGQFSEMMSYTDILEDINASLANDVLYVFTKNFLK